MRGPFSKIQDIMYEAMRVLSERHSSSKLQQRRCTLWMFACTREGPLRDLFVNAGFVPKQVANMLQVIHGAVILALKKLPSMLDNVTVEDLCPLPPSFALQVIETLPTSSSGTGSTLRSIPNLCTILVHFIAADASRPAGRVLRMLLARAATDFDFALVQPAINGFVAFCVKSGDLINSFDAIRMACLSLVPDTPPPPMLQALRTTAVDHLRAMILTRADHDARDKALRRLRRLERGWAGNAAIGTPLLPWSKQLVAVRAPSDQAPLEAELGSGTGTSTEPAGKAAGGKGKELAVFTQANSFVVTWVDAVTQLRQAREELTMLMSPTKPSVCTSGREAPLRPPSMELPRGPHTGSGRGRGSDGIKSSTNGSAQGMADDTVHRCQCNSTANHHSSGQSDPNQSPSHNRNHNTGTGTTCHGSNHAHSNMCDHSNSNCNCNDDLPVGIDCEWKDPTEYCAVLQISAGSSAWVIDTSDSRHSDAEYGRALLEFVTWFFATQGLLRLGFGFRGDIHKIGCLLHKLAGMYSDNSTRHSPARPDGVYHRDDGAAPSIAGADTAGATVYSKALAEANAGLWATTDIQQHSKALLAVKDTPSLASVAVALLGTKLDKAEQRSDWEQRPLSTQQIRYAGMDAYVLTKLYAALQAQHAITLTPSGTLDRPAK